MIILALDPGPEKTACVVYDTEKKIIRSTMFFPNNQLVVALKEYSVFGFRGCTAEVLVCEHIQSMGMAVGKSVFETCYWIGHFRGIWSKRFERIYRSEEKMHLCNSVRAKDSNIRQALIDKFPASGGGKCPQIGTKKKPGPLYGISGDLWSALAVAVTFAETKCPT